MLDWPLRRYRQVYGPADERNHDLPRQHAVKLDSKPVGGRISQHVDRSLVARHLHRRRVRFRNWGLEFSRKGNLGPSLSCHTHTLSSPTEVGSRVPGLVQETIAWATPESSWDIVDRTIMRPMQRVGSKLSLAMGTGSPC